jgi:general stress protein YciG
VLSLRSLTKKKCHTDVVGHVHGGLVVHTGERKERRGFASMSPEKQREIASKGGRAAHEKGTAHEWTADEARNAGRKGGQVSRGGRGRLMTPDSDTGAPAAADGISTISRAE